jgi:hypothetical protein
MKSPLKNLCRLLAVCTSILLTVLIDSAHGQQTVRAPGKIIVAKVIGKVVAVSPAGTKTSELKANDTITEKYTVITEAESSAVLVFSNGSTVGVKADSVLVIEEFLQDPFSDAFSMSTASEEPTTSTTKLNLEQGELVCNVKKLKIDGDQASSFTVLTPAGAAGVRGTAFSTSFKPDKARGAATYTLSVVEGNVVFTDSKGRSTVVVAGKSLTSEVQIKVDAQTGNITVTSQSEALVTTIIDSLRNAIMQFLQEMAEASNDMIIGPFGNPFGLMTPAPLQDINLKILPTPIDPDPTSKTNPEKKASRALPGR